MKTKHHSHFVGFLRGLELFPETVDLLQFGLIEDLG